MNEILCILAALISYAACCCGSLWLLTFVYRNDHRNIEQNVMMAETPFLNIVFFILLLLFVMAKSSNEYFGSTIERIKRASAYDIENDDTL